MLTKLFLSDSEDKILRDRYLAWGMGYGEAKNYLTEKLLAFTWSVQKIYHELTDEVIISVIERGTVRASTIARMKIEEINRKVGFML
jgi:hypothetical protein